MCVNYCIVSFQELNQADARDYMNTVGVMMLGIYTGFMIIILVNMLIAMMSHSYEVIQVPYRALHTLSVHDTVTFGIQGIPT